MSTPVYLPPELPPYLKSVYDLKSIVGTPSDDEVIGIHAVIRMAQKAVDIPGTGDPALLAQLYEHLFDIQIAKYRNQYLSAVFPETTTYTPPTLPAHVAVQLEPVTGAPCEEEVMKVQSAIRSYDQFANAPTLFDPRVGMELSQHLFDIQMARYTVRVNECHVSQSVQHPSSNCTRNSSSSCTRVAGQSMTEGPGTSMNDAGVGTVVADFYASAEDQRGIDTQNAIERSNQLVEQTNQLIERSNQIAERANQLVDKCSHPAEQSNKLLERFSQLFERLNEHLDQSNRVMKESMQPVEKIGDVLRNINRVLVRIQHAIVRNHKGNTIRALECLVNEKGETPSMSFTTKNRTYSDFSEHSVPVVIDGVSQNSYMSDSWLGEFLRFYGIGGELFDDTTTVYLKEGKMKKARVRLSEYLTSCLG
ncbi:putative laminin domain protein [Rhizoctonia solani 123E]|uniref:Putative laminin domain protein n=1 Tax=Rhizoctonia solani 123E TaxID=1423351 RepID=A0A074RUV5_9AGAM|nr:putative laminin domain protein [Rhizoctonia solani 123E]